MLESKKINWFWAHRRNTSLHHMSIFAAGLRGKGWEPAINFWFDNQVYIGVPSKGVYIFYDKNQLSSKDKYKDIQGSIDSNKNFVGISTLSIQYNSVLRLASASNASRGGRYAPPVKE